MSDSKHQGGYTGIDRRAPRIDPGAKPGTPAPRVAVNTGGRHAAITNALYNWNSYKTWAEKIRGSWDDNK